MSQFKKGDVVRQVMPAPIEGVVAGFQACGETGAVQIRVEHQVDGETRERFFTADQLEASPADTE